MANNEILSWVVDYLQSINAKQMAFHTYECKGKDEAQIAWNRVPILEAREEQTVLGTTRHLDEYLLLNEQEPIWTNLANAHDTFALLADKCPAEHEVGLASCFKFDDKPLDKDKCPQLIFADMDVKDKPVVPLEFASSKLAQTAKGWHAYNKSYALNMKEWADLFLYPITYPRISVSNVDYAWVECSYKRRFAVLRLTGNTKVQPKWV